MSQFSPAAHDFPLEYDPAVYKSQGQPTISYPSGNAIAKSQSGYNVQQAPMQQQIQHQQAPRNVQQAQQFANAEPVGANAQAAPRGWNASVVPRQQQQQQVPHVLGNYVKQTPVQLPAMAAPAKPQYALPNQTKAISENGTTSNGVQYKADPRNADPIGAALKDYLVSLGMGDVPILPTHYLKEGKESKGVTIDALATFEGTLKDFETNQECVTCTLDRSAILARAAIIFTESYKKMVPKGGSPDVETYTKRLANRMKHLSVVIVGGKTRYMYNDCPVAAGVNVEGVLPLEVSKDGCAAVIVPPNTITGIPMKKKINPAVDVAEVAELIREYGPWNAEAISSILEKSQTDRHGPNGVTRIHVNSALFKYYEKNAATFGVSPEVVKDSKYYPTPSQHLIPDSALNELIVRFNEERARISGVPDISLTLVRPGGKSWVDLTDVCSEEERALKEEDILSTKYTIVVSLKLKVLFCM